MLLLGTHADGVNDGNILVGVTLLELVLGASDGDVLGCIDGATLLGIRLVGA